MLDARALYERMSQDWLSGAPVREEVYAEDVVIETPFSPAGTRRRIEGRAAWLEYVGPARAGFPGRLEEHRTIALHETTDPETIVVEYELVGTVGDGRRASARFVVVVRARGGQIVLWREYQDVLSMAEALGRPLQGLGS